MKLIKYIVIIVLGTGGSILYSATIGSDSTVTRFNTQQILNNGDRIAGFAALKDGFIITSGSGTFDSFFSISGPVDLNGQTLILNRDFVFSNTSSFETLGNIIGNSHAFELPPMDLCIPVDSTICDCTVDFLTSLTSQPDDVYSIDWSYNDQYIASGFDGNAGNTFRIYNFNGTNLTQVYGVQLDNDNVDVTAVRWHPSKYLVAVGRQYSLLNPTLFILSFDPTQPIPANRVTVASSIGSLVLGTNSITSVAWHPSGNYLATLQEVVGLVGLVVIYPVNASGVIGGALVSVSLLNGVNLSNQRETIAWNSTGDYLAIGTGTTLGTNEVFVYNFNPGTPSLTLNASYNAGTSVNVTALDWNQTFTNIIAIGTSSDDIRLLRHNATGGTLTQVGSSVTIGQDPLSLHWNYQGCCLGVGRASGSNTEFRTYLYNNNNADLTLMSSYEIGDDVRSVRWSHSDVYLAHGNDSNEVRIYKSDSSLGGFCVEFNNLKLFLNCNLTLKNCCITFSGDSVLGGKGYCLSLHPTCTVLVDSDSTLLVKDITIKGVHDMIIQGVDATSTFSFQDVELVLDGDYSFTVGRFAVTKDLDIVGSGYVFNYESDQISTIEECGCMTIHEGVTFNYAPSVNSNNRIQLVADTSKIALCGGTIQVQEPGWQLLKGEFIVKDRSFICAESYAALTMGDGSLESNNLNVHVFPAATLEILKGCVEYNNV